MVEIISIKLKQGDKNRNHQHSKSTDHPVFLNVSKMYKIKTKKVQILWARTFLLLKKSVPSCKTFLRAINNNLHCLVIVNVWFENLLHGEEVEQASISTVVLPNPINKKRGSYGNLGKLVQTHWNKFSSYFHWNNMTLLACARQAITCC